MIVAIVCLTIIVLLQMGVIVRLVSVALLPANPRAAAAVRTGNLSFWAKRRARKNPETIQDPEERHRAMAEQAKPIGL